MRISHSLLFGIGLAGVVLSSCDDILEPSLDGKRIVLLTPADSSVSTGQAQTFRWEPLSGATRYRIQFAAPTFDNPAAFFLDTTTGSASFTTSLLPGAYRWRVQALNSAYASEYVTRLLRVDTTGNLGGQAIQLRRPVNQLATNTPAVIFEWAPLSMAQRYLLHLTPHPRLVGTSGFDTVVTSAAPVALRLARRSQVYRWRVTALNATSLSESAEYRFEIDVTAPTAPGLSNPLNGATFSAQPISLVWSRTTADVVYDSVYVYQADQTTLLSSFPRATSTPATSLAVPAVTLFNGTYYWAVRSIDRAGNRSPLTAKRAFTYQ